MKHRTFLRRAGFAVAGVALLAGLALAGGRLASHRAANAPLDPRGEVLWTLLALGDTGRPAPNIPALSRQSAVARALAQEDELHPADALALLGDNFYFKGIHREDALERIRDNLVVPYCHFQSFDGDLSHAVEGDCPEPRGERHPVPIYAVLGNHDHGDPESADLQANEIPRYVSNWILPLDLARNIDLDHGVSLVLVDSTPLQTVTGPTPELVAALRASRGPWRILIAHHPVGTSNQVGAGAEGAGGIYTENIRQSIEAAGVTVQLMLAGHEHNLQMIDMRGGAPSLVAVSGGGSSPRPVKSSSQGRLVASPSLGFTRVRLEQRDGTTRLHVTPYRLSRLGSLFGFPAEPIGEWSVDVHGAVRAEAVAAEAPARS
jgi:hypothetical protein